MFFCFCADRRASVWQMMNKKDKKERHEKQDDQVTPWEMKKEQRSNERSIEYVYGQSMSIMIK